MDGLLEGLDSDVVDGLRANSGLDATRVNPLEVLDLTELNMARTLLTGEDLEGLGFNVNRGRGRSDSGLGSSAKSTKNPMSPSALLSETVLFMKPPPRCCGCCDDERLLRDSDSREKEGRRSIRGADADSGSGSCVS